MAAVAILAASSSTAWGWTTVTNTNGDTWNVNDALVPGLDTGSIHNTGTNSLQGYGGIRVKVPGSPRLNGILLRGFDLTPDSATEFTSKPAVQLGGVAVKRSLTFNTTDDYARFLDTFTNTTARAGDDRGRLRRPARLQHGHQPERDRVDLQRRHDAHAAPTSGRRSTRRRRRRHRRRSTARARRCPARSTAPATSCATRSRRAADDRRRAQPHRLRQHDHDPGGRDHDSLVALRRHRAVARRAPPAAAPCPPRARRSPPCTAKAADARRRAAARATSRPARPARSSTVDSRHQLRHRAGARARPDRRRPVARRHHELAVRRRRQVDHAAEGRHDVRRHDAREQIMRAYLDRIAAYDQRPARPALGDHGRARRDGPGQGRRRRPHRRRHAAAARHPDPGQGHLRHQGHADHRRLAASSRATSRPRTRGRWPSCARPARSSWARPTSPSSPPTATSARARSGQVWNAFDPSKSLDRLHRRLGRRRSLRSSPPPLSARRPATRCGARRARRQPRLAARHRRHAAHRRRDAADLRPGLRGRRSAARCRTSRCCSTRPRSTARPTRSTTSPTATARATGRRRWTPNALQGKVIGVPAVGVRRPVRHDRAPSDAMRAQFAHFVAAGATVKAITDPPSGPASHARRPRLRGLAPVAPRPPGQPVHRRRRRSSAARCACRSSATRTRTPAPAR